MEITASLVNQLRQKTGAPLMDCKKALTESNGDFDAAIDYLRKKGAKVSALRSERDAKEGVSMAITSADGKKGVIVKLGCETDFVAKSADFVSFAQNIAALALNNNISSVDALKSATIDGALVADRITDLVGKIGEKIELQFVEIINGEAVVAYNHAGYRIGVLVALNQPINEKIEAVGKDIAMQIAAMNPVALDQSGVSQEIIDRELDIARDQIRQEGKPENMLEKIAAGKLQKFFKENTLLAQQFVKDNNKTVADVLKETDANLKVLSFKRVALN
jgi:elongation factor Ts